MKRLKHTCEGCETLFVIEYDELIADDDPSMCPFCGDYITDELDEVIDDVDL